jgi:tetratricopeptide (TPR) repeat protein
MAASSHASINEASKAGTISSGNDGKDHSQCEVQVDDYPTASMPFNVSDVSGQVREFNYEETEKSEAYTTAKSLMQEGEFDKSMEKIGAEIGILTAHLETRGEVDAALHPCLAPLYYLYGTTLLYSIEESSENLQAVDGDEEADDTQIAWENLETARMILGKMEKSNKHQLDLAQVHLRLGDLQRANGRYLESVSDYRACLESRLPLLGPYDRKVADTYYNLGLVYLLLAAEGDRHASPNAMDIDETEAVIISPEMREECRYNGLKHYLEAAKAFSGQIAILSGQNPDEIIGINLSQTMEGKTTGMSPGELEASEMIETLKAIRARIASMGEGDDVVDEYKEILDEIQETMNEAESSKDAMVEVSEIKHKAQAAAESGGEVMNIDGSVTTTGFGSTIVDPSVVLPLNPMMVVRKKVKLEKADTKPQAD